MKDSLEEARMYADSLVAIVHEPLWCWTPTSASYPQTARFTMFRTTRDETEGNLIYALGNQQWNFPGSAAFEILPQQTKLDGFLVEHDFPVIGHRVMRLNARMLHSDTGPDRILLAIEDVTGRDEQEREKTT